jgi:hypothetical protein
VNYFQALMERVLGTQKREQEKRDAEAEAYNRAMAENAEYIAGLERLPFRSVANHDESQ